MLSDAETDRSFQNKTRIPQQTHSWQCSDFTLLSWFAVLIQQVWPPKTSDGMLNIHPFSIIAYPELRVMSTNPSCLKVRLHSTPLLLCFFSHNYAFPAMLLQWCEWDGITVAPLCNFVTGHVLFRSAVSVLFCQISLLHIHAARRMLQRRETRDGKGIHVGPRNLNSGERGGKVE